MKNIKTEILEFNVNWSSIKRACLRTIGKEGGQKEPTKGWKRKLLICRHSPIRKGVITWRWSEIPEFVMGHFVRHHVGCTPFVQTSREDRTNVPREERRQTDLVSMEMDANIEALIGISEKRLCTCADPLTQAYAQSLRDAIEEHDEDIAWVMAPQCVRCGSCVEPFGNCKFYEKLMEHATREEQMDIAKRYDIYNGYQKVLKRRK